ncbi:MAG TPA: dihydroneopterin aldolase [Bacteroidales bacterium]|nr:dihydroneopterin aldolase [Bacteroidales bacterium]HQA85960.1 dihydroneopterin aldolase [Bacteroidales bacterium]
MKSKIILSGMEFYAFHGCYNEEKEIGTRFKVDVVLSGDFEKAAKRDDLSQTVNYQSVYNDIKQIMSKSANIIESVAYQIIKTLKDKYPLVEKVEVTVYKLNPSLGGKTAWVAVELKS